MNFDDPGWHLLDDFFIAEAIGRTAPTVRRYARVRGRLNHFLDTADMGEWLGAPSATLLSAEREFHDRGAFWQLFGPHDLVGVLPGFLLPPWLPDGSAESRSQISLTSRLLTHVVRQRLLDLSMSRLACRAAEVAVRQARIDRDARSAAHEPDERAAEMPAKFRQEPGPQW